MQQFLIDFCAAPLFNWVNLTAIRSVSLVFVLFMKPTFYVERVTVKGTEEINPDDVIAPATSIYQAQLVLGRQITSLVHG